MALTSKLGTSESALVGSTMAAGIGVFDPLIQTLVHELGMEQTVGQLGDASSLIVLQHNVGVTLVIDDIKHMAHAMAMSHSVFIQSQPFVAQNLGVSHVVDVVNFGPIVQNMDRFTHKVEFSGPIPIELEQTISLLSTANYPIELSHSLNLTHFAADVQKDEMNMTHSVIAFVNQDSNFLDELALVQTVQAIVNYDTQLTHTEVVTHAVAFYIDDGTSCPFNEWSNYGTLGDIPFTAATGASLTFASLDGANDIVFLRNPELDDRDRLGYTRINRESRGGELQVFRDPTWPTVNTLQGSIIGLKLQDVKDLLQFFEDHLGEEIALNDWHGRYWRGVIMNPGEPAVEDTRDRWTVAFEFEGVEMPGPDVIQKVGLDHTLNVIQDLTRDMSHALGIGHTVVAALDEVLHNTDNVFYRGDTVVYSGPA